MLPPTRPTSSSQSSSENFEARIRATSMAHHNPASTAVMGKVVESKPPRLCSSEHSPFVLFGGHMQATLYSVADQVVDIL